MFGPKIELVINITKAERVKILEEIDKIMEGKAKEILNKEKEKNVVLKLVMEKKINDFPVDEIKKLVTRRS